MRKLSQAQTDMLRALAGPRGYYLSTELNGSGQRTARALVGLGLAEWREEDGRARLRITAKGLETVAGF